MPPRFISFPDSRPSATLAHVDDPFDAHLVFDSRTLLKTVRDALAALERVQFTPRSTVTKNEVQSHVYCPFCRARRGVNLTAIRPWNWTLGVDRRGRTHGAKECQGNIEAVLTVLRGRKHHGREMRGHVPGRCTAKEWKVIVEQQRGKCFDCGRKRKLTKGHLVPIKHPKASHDAVNIIGQCASCNSRQGQAIHVEALARKIVSKLDVKRWADFGRRRPVRSGASAMLPSYGPSRGLYDPRGS